MIREFLQSHQRKVTRVVKRQYDAYRYRHFTNEHFYLEQWNSVYVPIPKVACTFLKMYLARIQGMETRLIHMHDLPRIPCVDLLPDLFVFAFVRDPVDRLISCYNDKIREESVTSRFYLNGIHRDLHNINRRHGTDFSRHMGFDDFLGTLEQLPFEHHDPHFRPQFTFVETSKGQRFVNKLYQVERIDEALGELQARLGLPPCEFGPQNVSKHKRISRNDLNRTQFRRIARLYERDFVLGGYDSGR